MADVEVTAEAIVMQMYQPEPTVSGSAGYGTTVTPSPVRMSFGTTQPDLQITELSGNALNVWWSGPRLFLKSTLEQTSTTSTYSTTPAVVNVKPKAPDASMEFEVQPVTITADHTVSEDPAGNGLTVGMSMSLPKPQVTANSAQNVTVSPSPISMSMSVSPTPMQTFTVTNDTSVARTEPLFVSVPFAEGAVSSTDDYVVYQSGTALDTAWRTLQTWQDGTVRIAQAQFYDEIPAATTQTYTIGFGTALTGSFTRNSIVEEAWNLFDLETYVFDPVETEADATPLRYECSMLSDATETELWSTEKARTYQYRGYHTSTASNAIAKGDFLSQTVYVTEHADCPILDVTVCIGNDYRGTDSPGGSTDPNDYPLGHVAINWAQAKFSGLATVFPVFRDEKDVRASYWQGNRIPGVWDLLHSDNTPDKTSDFDDNTTHYITDGSKFVWKFVVVLDDNAAVYSDIRGYSDSAQRRARNPMFPLVSLSDWQKTRGLSLMGGLVDGYGNAKAKNEYYSWRNGIEGFYGLWDDTGPTGTTGTPRNGYVHERTLWAVQDNYGPAVRVLQGMAMQQGLRAYHLWDVESISYDSDTRLLGGCRYLDGRWVPFLGAESLGRKDVYGYRGGSTSWPGYRSQFSIPFHGMGYMESLDMEHPTIDIVFDYWTLTGDDWAKQEIKEYAYILTFNYNRHTQYEKYLQSVRGEGWSMAVWMQGYLATGDTELRDRIKDRIDYVHYPQRSKIDGVTHSSKAFAFQRIEGFWSSVHWENSEGEDRDAKFYMPWQHCAVAYGFLAAYKYLGYSKAKEIVLDVVDMVDAAWIDNYDPDGSGVNWYNQAGIVDGIHYYTPATSYYNGTHNHIEAYHYDWPNPSANATYKNHYNPYCGDSPLGSANLFLMSALYYIADMFPDETQAEKANEYAGLFHDHHTGGNWREDRWKATMYPESIGE